MIGKLLSTVTKIVTIPLDIVNIGSDHLLDGDGSKQSRLDIPLLGTLEEIRDEICRTMEDADK